MKTFDSGARSSEEAPRLDLIPVASLIRQAARMAEGAKSHGERNYEKGASDPVFIRDRKNHLVLHALAYLNGQDDDDHLGAILANAGMLARLEQITAVPEVSADVPESGTFVPFAQWDGATWPTSSGVVTTTHDVTFRSSAAVLDHPDRSQMTYDEKRAELHQCRCGRMVHSDTACENAGKCLAGLHPHAKPLT